MNVIIFGTGMVFRQNKNLFSDAKILCFLDNDEEKWGMELDGHPVVSPLKVHDYDYDYIFLMSVHFMEMREQLRRLEVPEERIIDRAHLGPFEHINRVRRYEMSCGGDVALKKGRILLISHAFGLSGAPVVLVRFAEVLRGSGYHVEIYSRDCGEAEPLLRRAVRGGIPVSLYSRMEVLDIDAACRSYDLVIVNTVTLYAVIQKLSGRPVPVVWWLHEEEDVYRSMHFEMQEDMAGNNIYVYAVGERARAAYAKYSGDSSAGILPYGVEEMPACGTGNGTTHEKLVFALIGYGCERKGQDIVYEAACRQSARWRNQIEIWFIGEISETKQKMYGSLPCIRCMGVLEPDELKEIYGQVDVLVCPSLHDPMPVVVSEAMMHRKPCIVSDMTGQYEYIRPYVNGLTCTAGNVESLEEAVQWAIDNREKLSGIGEAGYDIYRKYFSMESFRNNAVETVEKYLPDHMGPLRGHEDYSVQKI